MNDVIRVITWESEQEVVNGERKKLIVDVKEFPFKLRKDGMMTRQTNGLIKDAIESALYYPELSVSIEVPRRR